MNLLLMFTTSLIFSSPFKEKWLMNKICHCQEQQSCKGKTTSVVTDMNGNFEIQMLHR
jgi:hypothetical protein